MGLAAGQARLLTITGRKSDCEFESMRISHQKIALARELADLSNEYQNSLTKTKLIYDYYGTGDTNTPLSYATLMTPSMLNDYMPTLVTDSMGRVALNSSYAAAARAAGIPQEGLGCLPSEVVRNKFVQLLADPTVGLITQDLANTISSLPYNQGAGFGGGAVVVSQTQDITFRDLCATLSNNQSVISGTLTSAIGSFRNADFDIYENGTQKDHWNLRGISDTDFQLDLGKLLSGEQDAYLFIRSKKNFGKDAVRDCQAFLEDLFDQAAGYLTEVLDLGDGSSRMALDYAYNQILEHIFTTEVHPDEGTEDYVWNIYDRSDDESIPMFIANNQSSIEGADKSIGWSAGKGKNGGAMGWGHRRIHARISIGNIMQAYLTYFADAMNGLSALDANGNEIYCVNENVSESKLVNHTSMFTIKTGVDVSSDDLAIAKFYDTLLNQICINGWTENNKVNDTEYLQQMLK